MAHNRQNFSYKRSRTFSFKASFGVNLLPSILSAKFCSLGSISRKKKKKKISRKKQARLRFFIERRV